MRVFLCCVFGIFILSASLLQAAVNDTSHSLSQSEAYYHDFQNYDDDVDRIKTYSNFFGGNYGTSNGSSRKAQITISTDVSETRTGYGRSLKIEYGPLTTWSMYAESFKRRWSDPTTSFNLNSLFPDYSDPEFSNRHIDSLVFYSKLIADSALTLKIELHDAAQGSSSVFVDIEAGDWQRISVALSQFQGTFDPTIAQYLGLTFSNYPNNQEESGVLYIDDFYLVENDYIKPVLSGDALLEYLNKISFRHFWHAVDPISKLALDRHTFDSLISVDGVGFQLAAYVIAHKNGWIDAGKIETRVETILNNLLHNCPHAAGPSQVESDPLAYATVDGNWAHFLNYGSLARKDAETEFSIFTNALLLSGVVVCQQYFSEHARIPGYADSLISLTDWNFFYMPDSQLVYYSWTPENGYSDNYSDWFTEELDLAFLLGISSPETDHRLPLNPFFSEGYYKPVCSLQTTYPYVYSASGSNFTYYFLQMYAKFGAKHSDTIPRLLNVQNALLADLEFCQNNYNSLGYDSRIFGTTACEGPDSAGVDEAADTSISNYHAYGYECRYDTDNEPNGTVAIYGSGAATLFIPDEAIACLEYYYNDLDSIFKDRYDYHFWSPIFGFPDAFHLKPDSCDDTLVNDLGFRGPWISVPRFAINVGPMLMNIDTHLSEKSQLSVRDYFSSSSNISGNLEAFRLIEGAICGDANSDLIINVGDPVFLINYIFKSGAPPVPLCTGDTNGDGAVNVADAVYIISYVFKGGPAPVTDCCS